MSKVDATLILGGGVTEEGTLPRWILSRLERSIALYQGEFVITLSAGTVHKPPVLDAHGYPIFESILAGEYLIQRGIEPTKILAETCSYDTIGNAYFSRVIHTAPRSFRKLLVITSEFHMARTQRIFEWIYRLDPPMPGYSLQFEAAPNDGIDAAALASRTTKEQKSLDALDAITSQLNTLQQLHHWLFTQHTAYAVGLKPPRLMGKILETY